MNVYKQIQEKIQSSTSIVITAHKSPDGDSVGSSLGLFHFLRRIGKNVTICHPDPVPDYLFWLQDLDQIHNFLNEKLYIEKAFASADLILCLDFNAPDRVGDDMKSLLVDAKCTKIMIDHHLNPTDFCEIVLSDSSVCSTSQLIFEVIANFESGSLLDEKIGTPLYLGILTDTGSFRFPSVQPRTHEILAKLLSVGVKQNLIHEFLNDNNNVSRVQLQGYAMSQKLDLLPEYSIGIVALTQGEMEKYNHQKGDTDGLPNVVLSIKGMKAAMLLVEKDGKVKMSFRSKGSENPVNILASDHFNGGGHANASGGISDLSLDETVTKLKTLIPNYFSKN